MTRDLKIEKPLLEVIVDARQFDEASFEQALDELRPHFRVGGGRSIKLSNQLPLLIVLSFAITTLQTLPANLLSSVLYDWLKKWTLHSSKDEVVTIVVKIRGSRHRTMDARITVRNSEDIAKNALATLSELARCEPSDESYTFDKRSKKWKKS